MTDSIYEYVMDQFAKTSMSYAEIAEGSTVPRRTVEKIARKEIKNPGVSSIELLAEFFKKAKKVAA